MLIDNDNKDTRLKSPRNLLNILSVTAPKNATAFLPLHNGGRSLGVPNIPKSLKIVAGVLSLTESAKSVADALDISVGAVHRAKHSANPEVYEAVTHATERIRDLALDRLMASLGIINDETLANVGAKDASIVARNLAGVVEKMSPQDAAVSQVKLIIYAPQQRTEQHYSTIDVHATVK